VRLRSRRQGVDLRDVVTARGLALQAASPGCQVLNIAALGWQFPTQIDRVYVIEKAERELGYRPAFNFAESLAGASHHRRASGCSRPDRG
jgi:nucleoside-diphosphate-sugar epimerase